MKNNRWLLILLSTCLICSPLFAQIDIRGKIQQKTTERVDRKLDQGIDKVLDRVEEGPEEREETAEPETESSTPSKHPVAEAQQKTALSTYSRYDFIPGERVIYFDDFSQDKIGDFPALWNTSKGGEVMTTNLYPGNWFMMKEDGLFYLEKGLKFPDNYTIEFDLIPVKLSDEVESLGLDLTILSTDEELFPMMAVPGKSGIIVNLHTPGYKHHYVVYNEAMYGMHGDYEKAAGLLRENEVNHVAIWVQKTRFRLYMHGEKIFDIPRAFQPGHVYDQIRFYTTENGYHLISNFRVADATPDTRSKLITEGKLVTRGITFDSGSDVIKPESYAVLKEISQVFKDNPSIRVKIIGHTDSDGSDVANLTLSKKRAASVKNALAKEFNIDAGRMETDGKGESEPVASNATAEGKANNRRVEFIKL